MMTLDEAIKHCEEVAEEQKKAAKEWHENQVRKCELIRFAEMDYTHENECKECASDHKQLAEWLKELKRLREQEPTLGKIRAEIVDTLYVDSLIFGELIDFKNGKIDADDVIEEFNRVTRMEVLRVIDKYRAEMEGVDKKEV